MVIDMMMKSLTVILLFLTALLYAQDKPGIAVMELEGNGVAAPDLGGLTNRLRAELVTTDRFTVIERSRMDEILVEQGFQQTGCTNTECAVQIGQLLGAEKIVLGSIDLVGTIYSVSLRLVDVATGKIEKTTAVDCEDCSINSVLKVTIHNAARILAGLEPDRQVEEKETAKPAAPLDPEAKKLSEMTVKDVQKLYINEWQKHSKIKPRPLTVEFSYRASAYNLYFRGVVDEWLADRAGQPGLMADQGSGFFQQFAGGVYLPLEFDKMRYGVILIYSKAPARAIRGASVDGSVELGLTPTVLSCAVSMKRRFGKNDRFHFLIQPGFTAGSIAGIYREPSIGQWDFIKSSGFGFNFDAGVEWNVLAFLGIEARGGMRLISPITPRFEDETLGTGFLYPKYDDKPVTVNLTGFYVTAGANLRFSIGKSPLDVDQLVK